MSKTGIAELTKVQRRIALRVACAYRTVFIEALQIVSSIPSLDLQARVRKLKYEQRREPKPILDKQTEDDMISTWQNRWDSSLKGR